jgi:hypothetical protein
MAKIVEEVLVVKFSAIAKDSSSVVVNNLTDEVIAALEQVAQELVGSGVVVELERA